jgi:hypothetical protein
MTIRYAGDAWLASMFGRPRNTILKLSFEIFPRPVWFFGGAWNHQSARDGSNAIDWRRKYK